ncbi:MAG: plastocyanin/azurin family copper-binding protein [Acidimicrobiia bacterium]
MTNHPNRSATRFCAVLGAGFALFALTGCGGGDGSPSASSAPPASSASPTPTAAAGAAGSVQIAGFAFAPSTLTVAAGTNVTWTNSDRFDHSIRSSDKTFDSKNLGEGESFSHIFATPGTYSYVCGIHNSMTGSIVVTA